VLPTFAPSRNPTPAPVYKNVCSAKDAEVFGNYDDFVMQASSCSSDCKVQLFTLDATSAQNCIKKCSSLANYTAVCVDCMAFYIIRQQQSCAGPCLTDKSTDLCNNCTNTYCRDGLKTCTGIETVSIGTGTRTLSPGTSGAETSPDAGTIIGITGGSLAGLLVFAGLVVVGRRIRDNKQVSNELVSSMRSNLFRGETTDIDFFSLESANPVFEIESTWRKSRKSRKSTKSATNNELGGVISEHTGIKLRTRYSFHGEVDDELDVGAGVSLTALGKNDLWWLCFDELSGKVGLIPSSYVTEV
jgi:hypothetical protein